MEESIRSPTSISGAEYSGKYSFLGKPTTSPPVFVAKYKGKSFPEKPTTSSPPVSGAEYRSKSFLEKPTTSSPSVSGAEYTGSSFLGPPIRVPVTIAEYKSKNLLGSPIGSINQLREPLYVTAKSRTTTTDRFPACKQATFSKPSFVATTSHQTAADLLPPFTGNTATVSKPSLVASTSKQPKVPLIAAQSPKLSENPANFFESAYPAAELKRTAHLFPKSSEKQANVFEAALPAAKSKNSTADLFPKSSEKQANFFDEAFPAPKSKSPTAYLFPESSEKQANFFESALPAAESKRSTTADLFPKSSEKQANFFDVAFPAPASRRSPTAHLFPESSEKQANFFEIASPAAESKRSTTADLFPKSSEKQADFFEEEFAVAESKNVSTEFITTSSAIVSEPLFKASSEEQLLEASFDSKDSFEPLLTSSPTPLDKETSALQGAFEPEVSLVTFEPSTSELQKSLITSDNIVPSEPVANVDSVPSEPEISLVTLEPSTSELQKSLIASDNIVPSEPVANVDSGPSEPEISLVTLEPSATELQKSLITSDNSLLPSEPVANVDSVPSEPVANVESVQSELEVSLVTFEPSTSELQGSLIASDNSLVPSKPVANVDSVPSEPVANVDSVPSEPEISLVTLEPSTSELQKSLITSDNSFVPSEPVANVDSVPSEPEVSLVTLEPSTSELQKSLITSDNSLVPSEPVANIDSVPSDPEKVDIGVDNKPSTNDTSCFTEKPLISDSNSSDTKPGQNKMWNNQLSSTHTNSSHEFFDSFGSNPNSQQPQRHADQSSQGFFDSIGLSESTNGPSQSRADHTIPSNQVSAEEFKSPAQYVQNSGVNTPPFQTVQTFSTSAEIFQPQHFEVSNSQPQEKNLSNAPGHHLKTQVPYTSVGAKVFQNIEDQQTATNAPQTLYNPSQFFVPQTDTHSFEVTNSDIGVENVRNNEDQQPSTDPPQGLNNPSQFFVPQTDTSFEVSGLHAGAENLQNSEHQATAANVAQGVNNRSEFFVSQTNTTGSEVPSSFPPGEQLQTHKEQPPPQSWNTTAHLFNTAQPDPFGMATTTYNASGTAQLFSNTQHNDPFEGFSASRNDLNQSSGPPLTSTASQLKTPAYPLGADGSQFHAADQQEAFIEKPSAPGSFDQNYQTSLPYQGKTSDLQANVPPSSSNVLGFAEKKNPYGDEASNTIYPPNSFSARPLPTATTQEVVGATNQVTGETIPAEVPGQDIVKTVDHHSVEQSPPTFEPAGQSSSTENIGPPFLQPPTSGFFPPSIGATSPSLYPPELMSSQPVGQRESLYPPGMADLYPDSLQPPSNQMGNTTSYNAGQLFTPDPNLLPPTNSGDFMLQHGNLGVSDVANNLTLAQSASTTSLQSEPKATMSNSEHFTNDPEGKQITSSLKSALIEGDEVALKSVEDYQSLNTNNLSISANNLSSANYETKPLSQDTPQLQPIAQAILSEQSCKTDEAGKLLNPSGEPFTSFQPGPEPVRNEKLGETAEQFHKNATVTYADNRPSSKQQIPPHQAVTEPMVMQVHTEAVYAEPDVSGLNAQGGTPPSAVVQAPPPLRDISSHLDVKQPSNDQLHSQIGNQQKTTTADLYVGTEDRTNTSMGPTNVVPEILGENPHPSAFIPVKANSPYDERSNLESPLRSPVQREKKEALLPGSIIQTSLWGSEPQLSIPGLIVPASGHTSSHGAHHSATTPQQADVPAQSLINKTVENSQPTTPNVEKPIFGIPGFTQTKYPFTDARVKSNDPSVPSNTTQQIRLVQTPSTQPDASTPTHQELQSTTSLRSEGSAQDTTSSLSRQSSLGISVENRDQTVGKVVYDREISSDIIRGNYNQG